MINNSSFKAFLELVPWLREMIADFYSGKYAACLASLEKRQVRVSRHNFVTILFDLRITGRASFGYVLVSTCG